MRRLGALRRLINSWSLLEPVEHFLCAVSVVLHFVFERSQEERRIPAPSCSTKTAFIPTTPTGDEAFFTPKGQAGADRRRPTKAGPQRHATEPEMDTPTAEMPPGGVPQWMKRLLTVLT